jgi:hydrogenase maturation protease
MSMQRITIFVCGDPLRGDDAVADALVRALPGTTRGLSEAIAVGGLMPDDLLDHPGPVIVVDAVRGLPPGTVVDLPLSAVRGLVEAGVTPGSSHALPLPTVLGVVEAICGSALAGRFIGVAGEDFGIGAALSGSVRAAVEPGAARLGHWIRALAHGGRAAACA